MPSSERIAGFAPWMKTAWVCTGILLAACSMTPLPRSAQSSVEPPAPVACFDAEASETKDSIQLAVLRRSVEAGPLYAVASASSSVAGCRVERRAGAVLLRYDFADGGQVLARRDDRIEYSEQVVRLVSPLVAPAVDTLKRAERTAFGANGCGIAWQQPETRIADAEPGASDVLFRGEVCNCAAHFRRDATGRVVELAIKSAC